MPEVQPLPPNVAAAPVADPAQAQHPGRRDSQQDAFGFSRLTDAAFAAHAGQLAVLADGMGGMHNGLWAASHAVQAFVDAYHAKTADEAVPAALQRALAAASRVVHDEAARLDAVDRMGTTLAVAVVCNLELHWLNVGDSRVYLAEGEHLMCLSTDHSYSAVLRRRVHRGELSAGEALGHPLRDALTSYLGRPPPVKHAASAAAVQLRPGARVLLCSDGLTQALDDKQIGALVGAQLQGSAQQACDRLLQAALERRLPDQDNITAVMLQVPRPGQVLESGSVSRAVYDLPPLRSASLPLAAAAAPSLPQPASAAAPRWAHWAHSSWREPLWWAGAVATLGALALLWFSRSPDPAPAAPPPSAGSARPTVDLLAPAAAPAPSPAGSSGGRR